MTHVLIDFKLCKNGEALFDAKIGEAVARRACELAKMTVVGMVKKTDFIVPDTDDRETYSLVLLLAESHCSIHCSPELDMSCSIDLYSCRPFNAHAIYDVFLEGFEPAVAKMKIIDRNERFS